MKTKPFILSLYIAAFSFPAEAQVKVKVVLKDFKCSVKRSRKSSNKETNK